MAANTRPTGATAAPALAPAAPGIFASASVSVGQADWASEVIHNVVGDKRRSSDDGAQEASEASEASEAPRSPSPPLGHEERVRRAVLERKRKFHSQRCLELKNLPDGVTEQVGSGGLWIKCRRRGGALKCRRCRG